MRVNRTTYRWFDGKVQSVDGVLQGEELTANDEYTVENGVTTLKLTGHLYEAGMYSCERELPLMHC